MLIKKKRIILTGYKIGSRSLRNLQKNLKETTDRRVLRVRKNSIKYKQRQSDKIITWGVVNPCQWEDQQQAIAKHIACNKLLTFRKFKEHGIPHPEWTTDLAEALLWHFDGITTLARTTLTGHSGNGIVFLTEAPWPAARLYVKYKKKKHEYRVHVFNNKVIDITQKKRRAGFENRNNQIRNHKNGWVYCRENISTPAGMEQIALDACNAIGLNSGAVDIIWNEKENQCYVLEINNAPGIEGTTLHKYTQEIRNTL